MCRTLTSDCHSKGHYTFMVIQCIQLLHAQGMATKSAKFSDVDTNNQC